MGVLAVTALKYAESTLPERMVLQNGSDEKQIPISFTIYLLRTENRLILVDAGCDTMPGFNMKHFISPAELLRQNGITPSDITDVVVTHSHHDHIDALRHFPDATVYLTEEEYEPAKPYLPQHCRIELFSEEAFPANGVRALKIGGHSPGSCVVLFRMQNRDFVICGDECYTRLCYDKNTPTGTSYNPQKSKEFLERFRPEQYHILFCHDNTMIPGRNGLYQIT